MLDKSQYRAFHTDGDSLHYKGVRYALSDIAHIEFANVLTTHSVNLVETGKTASAALRIVLHSGRAINLSFDEWSLLNWFRSKTKEDIGNLNALYQFLATKTFAQRLQFYMAQVSQRGYFEYDECKFYPGDKIVFRRKEFPIRSSSFLKGSGYVELRPKNWTILDKIKREASFTKIPQFNYVTDTDVIFHILERSFGLGWN